MNQNFDKTTLSSIFLSGGPSSKEQMFALANGSYWTVLNSHLLRKAKDDEKLVKQVNVIKALLQTHGPYIPQVIHNKGKAKHFVFHAHAETGTTYVLEWAIVEPGKVMALVGFDSHENYPFRQDPLSEEEKKKILKHPLNIKIMQRVEEKRVEAKNKIKKNNGGYTPGYFQPKNSKEEVICIDNPSP